MITLTKLICAHLVVLGVFFSVTASASAPKTSLIEQKGMLERLSPVDAIKYHSSIYNAPTEELLTVAKCESGFNPKAVGDGGSAISIFQYHKQTFYSFAKLMGEELDYYSYFDQSKLTAFIFANYPEYKSHWTCFTKFYK